MVPIHSPMDYLSNQMKLILLNVFGTKWMNSTEITTDSPWFILYLRIQNPSVSPTKENMVNESRIIGRTPIQELRMIM